MKTLRITYLIFAIFLLSTCVEEESKEFGYPTVTTIVEIISPQGVRFTGTIQFKRLEEVIDHGFVWGPDKELPNETSYFYSLGSASNPNFSATIGSTLKAKTSYYVRSFAKTKSKIVYGPMLQFISLGSEGPQVISFAPSEGAFGDTVKISGKNFSFKTTSNVVRFGGENGPIALVTKATDTLLSIIVPSDVIARENTIHLWVGDQVTAALNTFTIRAPAIKSVARSTFTVCDTIEIHGSTLNAFGQKASVNFNNFPGQLVSLSPEKIKVVMPWIVQNPVQVKISGSLFEQTAPFTLTQIQPTITSVEPLLYSPGDTITAIISNKPACQKISASFSDPYHNSFTVKIVDSTTVSIRFVAPTSCIQSPKLRISGKTFSIASEVSLKQKPPTIVSIEPNRGRPGDPVVITGTNFWQSYDATNLLNVQNGSSSTQLVGTVRELALMEGPTVDVIAKGCGGTATAPAAFTFETPEIHSVSPTFVTLWDETITIYGKNFSRSSNTIEISGETTYGTVSMDGDQLTFPVNAFIGNQQLSKQLSGPVTVTTVAGLSVVSTQNVNISYESIWREESDFPGAARIRPTSLVMDGKAYAGLGTSSDLAQSFTDWWEFDGSTWTQKASFPGVHSGWHNQAASANGKGYMGLFNSEMKWWEYNPATDQWQRKADFPGEGRSNHFVFSINDKVYVGGGYGSTGALLDFWEYNPGLDQWTLRSPLPHYAMGGPLAFEHAGIGYAFAAGRTLPLSTLKYDPSLNQWSTSAVVGIIPPISASQPQIMKFAEYAIMQVTPIGQSPRLYQFTPSTNSFKEVISNYGGTRRLPATFALYGRGYVGLGMQSSLVNTMLSFDASMLQFSN